MQIRKLLFFGLFFTSALIVADCCNSTKNCSSSNNAKTSESCDSTFDTDDTRGDDCFFKSCVSCKSSCNLEHRCCNDNGDFFGKTFFSMRPQDSNVARRILSSGTNGYDFRDIDNSCFNDCNARACVTLEYQQSFNAKKKLARWFSFNCDECRCMSIGVPSSKQKFDINAIELGITTTSSFNPANVNAGAGALGEICLSPKIRNIIADLDFKFDLSNCVCNSWARVNMVIANCKTELHLDGDTTEVIGSAFPAGYFASSEVSIPYNSVLDAFEAQSPFGEVPRMKYGRFSNHEKSKTGVAGIHIDLGYDFVRCERGHLGASVHVVLPTGTRPKGVFIFEPVIGANKSWQVGATVNASYDLYKGCNNNRLTLFFDSVLTHLFKARQYRPFQLKNGPGSEFLILKKFDCVGTEIGLERAANILHGETRIGANIMFDGALMLQYSHCNFFGDIGYNFWYRSKEKRSNTVCFSGFEENKFGIKGAQANLTDPASQFCTVIPGGCTPVNETASKTTISTTAADDAKTTFIGLADIDFSAPLNPHALSNKIFASLGYQFECKYPIYFLIGGEVEFGQDNRAVNQWGVLGQFGVSF